MPPRREPGRPAQVATAAVLLGSAGAGDYGWTFGHAGQTARGQGDPAAGLGMAADALAARYAPASTRGVSTVPVRIGGLTGVRAYASLTTYLDGLSLVRSVSLRELSGSTALLDLGVRGDLELLRRIVALDGRLVPAPRAGSDNGDAGVTGLRLAAMSLRHLPNLLCVLRILLVYPVAHWILQERYADVMLLFAVAASTDALDGFLAKRFGWTSELGKFLDPLADKLLLLAVFICLSVNGVVPWLLTGLVLLRDLVIVFGALTYKLLFGPVNGNPTIASKLNTVTQIVFCLAVVAAAAYRWPADWVVILLGAMVLFSTCVSGIDYTLIYVRRAQVVVRERASRRH